MARLASPAFDLRIIRPGNEVFSAFEVTLEAEGGTVEVLGVGEQLLTETFDRSIPGTLRCLASTPIPADVRVELRVVAPGGRWPLASALQRLCHQTLPLGFALFAALCLLLLLRARSARGQVGAISVTRGLAVIYVAAGGWRQARLRPERDRGRAHAGLAARAVGTGGPAVPRSGANP